MMKNPNSNSTLAEVRAIYRKKKPVPLKVVKVPEPYDGDECYRAVISMPLTARDPVSAHDEAVAYASVFRSLRDGAIIGQVEMLVDPEGTILKEEPDFRELHGLD